MGIMETDLVYRIVRGFTKVKHMKHFPAYTDAMKLNININVKSLQLGETGFQALRNCETLKPTWCAIPASQYLYYE